MASFNIRAALVAFLLASVSEAGPCHLSSSVSIATATATSSSATPTNTEALLSTTTSFTAASSSATDSTSAWTTEISTVVESTSSAVSTSTTTSATTSALASTSNTPSTSAASSTTYTAPPSAVTNGGFDNSATSFGPWYANGDSGQTTIKVTDTVHQSGSNSLMFTLNGDNLEGDARYFTYIQQNIWGTLVADTPYELTAWGYASNIIGVDDTTGAAGCAGIRMECDCGNSIPGDPAVTVPFSGPNQWTKVQNRCQFTQDDLNGINCFPNIRVGVDCRDSTAYIDTVSLSISAAANH